MKFTSGVFSFLLLGSAALSSCNQPSEFTNSLFPGNPRTDQCPVFDIDQMAQAGLSFPAEIEGFLVVPPPSTSECKGSRGYKYLIVYSPLVPQGDMQVTPAGVSGNGGTAFSVTVSYGYRPLTDDLQFKIRDALQGNPNLFNLQGSLRKPRGLENPGFDLALNGDSAFEFPQYPDRAQITVPVSELRSVAEDFAKKFNSGQISISLFHDWTGISDGATGLSDYSRFFVSELFHASVSSEPGKQPRLHSLSPLEALARVWARSATPADKQRVIGRSLQWLARSRLEGAQPTPTLVSMTEFCKANWNPKPAFYDAWAFDSLNFLAMVAPTPEIKTYLSRFQKINGLEADRISALREAVEITLSHVYSPEEIDAVVQIASKIRDGVDGVKSPWQQARAVFDGLGKDPAASLKAVEIAAWIAAKDIFDSADPSGAFGEAIRFLHQDPAGGGSFEQVKNIYLQVSGWDGLRSFKPDVWTQVLEWVLKDGVTADPISSIQDLYAWFISAPGMKWSPDRALKAAGGYILGQLHATPDQIQVFKDAITWLRSPDGPHLNPEEVLLARAQALVFARKMTAPQLDLLKQKFQGYAQAGQSPKDALDQAEKDVFGG